MRSRDALDVLKWFRAAVVEHDHLARHDRPGAWYFARDEIARDRAPVEQQMSERSEEVYEALRDAGVDPTWLADDPLTGQLYWIDRAIGVHRRRARNEPAGEEEVVQEEAGARRLAAVHAPRQRRALLHDVAAAVTLLGAGLAVIAWLTGLFDRMR